MFVLFVGFFALVPPRQHLVFTDHSFHLRATKRNDSSSEIDRSVLGQLLHSAPMNDEEFDSPTAESPKLESPTPSCFLDHPPQLLILDVDGVLTSNHILLDGAGQEWKPFFIPDGVGIKMLRLVGVPTALISGRKSEVTHRRARELSIDWHKSGISDKGAATRELLQEGLGGKQRRGGNRFAAATEHGFIEGGT